jgi:hypothetical protein
MFGRSLGIAGLVLMGLAGPGATLVRVNDLIVF